ncbi:MAG TPA: CUAEP/CCAEP-tail radical SAM protein [Thermoanaerobaculia bacterium]
MQVALVSTYELGRQPFGIASPAAWLKREGCAVTCLDLAVKAGRDKDREQTTLAAADLVAFYVPMHTATRLAAGLVPRVRQLNPDAHLCFYGLYAPVNESFLRRLGGHTILGGEFEEGLISLVRRLSAEGGLTASAADGDCEQPEPRISLGRQSFVVPDRSGLPALDRYARMQMPSGALKTVGYTEATRGCKHLCRHCPIVPVYGGNFRIVQRDVVLEDIRGQVARGADHITFGDPDFFNGPTHAVKLVQALHEEFPELTYDVTIKVEHLLKQRQHLPALRDTGCLFVTCAVESIDPRVLEIFDKGHSRQDFVEAARQFREVGLTMNPTFVTFTPWTTIESYLELLHTLLELDLIENVSPIQYAIRLLITESSRLLELPEVRQIIGEFDEQRLVYPWEHTDPQVDRLCEDLLEAIQEGQRRGETRRQIFQRVWQLAHQAYEGSCELSFEVANLGQVADRATIPYLTEPWYC